MKVKSFFLLTPRPAEIVMVPQKLESSERPYIIEMTLS